MKILFEYSTLYYWRNVLSVFAPLLLFLLITPAILNRGIDLGAVLVIVIFLSMETYAILLFRRMRKMPKRIELTEDLIIADYIKGKQSKVNYNDIDKLTVKPLGLATLVNIKSAHAEEIKFTSHIKNFNVLMETLSEKYGCHIYAHGLFSIRGICKINLKK